MNQKLTLVVALFLLIEFPLAQAQRPLPKRQSQEEASCSQVAGTWRWFDGATVEVLPNGDFQRVADNGVRFTGKVTKLDSGNYKFNWENDRWIDLLKLKKGGNYLEGKNHAGNNITAAKISSTIKSPNTHSASSGDGATGNPAKKEMSNPESFVGEWRMSSWDGHYRLSGDGRVTIENDPSKPTGGRWFIAYDRLYLVWSDCQDVDVFKLNPDKNMTLARIDNRSNPGVTFQKKNQ